MFSRYCKVLPALAIFTVFYIVEGDPKSLPACENNEIYLIDGDKTLLLTSNGMTKDLNTIEHSHRNLILQIRNQDKVIQFLKQRLNHTELQLDESLNILATQENSFRSTLDKLNSTRLRLDSLKGQNVILEDQHGKDENSLAENKKEIADLKARVINQEREITNLKRNITGEMGDMAESLRVEQNSCENQLRNRETSITQLSEKVIHLEESLDICKRTNFGTGDCGLVKAQLNQQDETIRLLKIQIKNQEASLDELQKLLITKQEVVNEFRQRIKDTTAQDHFTIKLTSQDRLIRSQQETIGLLKHVGDEDNELSKAKDAAVKILMNTVQSMVLNIAQCKHNAIEGLQKRISQLQEERDKMKSSIDDLKAALSNSKVFGKFQHDLQNSVSRLLRIRNRTLSILESQENNSEDIQDSLIKRCQSNEELSEKLEQFYRPANNLTCQNFCDSGKFTFSRKELSIPPDGCNISPDLVKSHGLIKLTFSNGDKHLYVPVGHNLTYVCENEKMLEDGTGRTFQLLCEENGRFMSPNKVPKCVS